MYCLPRLRLKSQHALGSISIRNWYHTPQSYIHAQFAMSSQTQKQQTNVGGWVLRSGGGQLRETGSTSAAPPATSRATNPRQHRPKDLSKPRRDIHLVEIMYCEDTRPQNQLNAAKEQHKDLCNILQGASVTLHVHHPFIGCVWVASSTTPAL